MLTTIVSPLRYTIAGLGLFAGIASAHAAPGLAITFEQDVASGQLSITFSGEATNPFEGTDEYSTSYVHISSGTIVVAGGDLGTTYYSLPQTSGWSVQDLLLLSAPAGNPSSYSGTGGFTYNETLGSTLVEILSTTNSGIGGSFVWNAQAIYLATLFDFGLSDGESGTIIFTKNGNSISVNWSAVVIPVPEPATYALVLGLGVAGVALLRRRARS